MADKTMQYMEVSLEEQFNMLAEDGQHIKQCLLYSYERHTCIAQFLCTCGN